MESRLRRATTSLWPWALGLCLIMVLGKPAEAQDLRSFTNTLLKWPEPELDDESKTDSEENEREEFIETDRNSFTFAPFTPGDGWLIVESAYSYISIGQEGAKHSFPETVFRYGIGDLSSRRISRSAASSHSESMNNRRAFSSTSDSVSASDDKNSAGGWDHALRAEAD